MRDLRERGLEALADALNLPPKSGPGLANLPPSSLLPPRGAPPPAQRDSAQAAAVRKAAQQVRAGTITDSQVTRILADATTFDTAGNADATAAAARAWEALQKSDLPQ